MYLYNLVIPCLSMYSKEIFTPTCQDTNTGVDKRRLMQVINIYLLLYYLHINCRPTFAHPCSNDIHTSVLHNNKKN